MKFFSLNKLQEQALEVKIINMRLKVSKKVSQRLKRTYETKRKIGLLKWIEEISLGGEYTGLINDK